MGGAASTKRKTSPHPPEKGGIVKAPSIIHTTSTTTTTTTMTMMNYDDLVLRIKELETDNTAYKLELKLMYSLDDIRDDFSDPAQMFSAILSLMTIEFKTDMCILYLFDRESEELELWAQEPIRTDIEKRIRQPPALFSFLEEKNKLKANSDLPDLNKDVKITLLDEFPPSLVRTGPRSFSPPLALQPLRPNSLPPLIRNSLSSLPPPLTISSSPPSNLLKTSSPPSPLPSSSLPPLSQSPSKVEVGSIPAHLAAITIIMHGKQMGLLILGRNQPFTDLDIRLLKAAESQIDSAVVQAHNNIDFMLSNKELEVIYRVDRIRDENHSLEDLLESAVKELDDVIMADMTFVMLYKVLEGKLTLQAASSSELWMVGYKDFLEKLGQEALDATKLVWHNNDGFAHPADALSGGLRSRTEEEENITAAMCVPLILQNQIIGVFGALNTKNKSPFLLAQRRLLRAIASQMDNAIYDSLETFRLRQVLGRSVDRKVLEKLLLNPNVEVLKPERTVCTVLFADIRGSTQLAERTPADLLGRYINAFLSTMSQVIIAYEGTLDKFIGDEVMAIFNAPFAQPDHALRALSVGFAMQEQHQKLMEKWKELGISPTPIGVGIATGELIAGEYGCSLRTDYTVIGRAANLGARITGLASGGTVLCSDETYQQIKDAVEAEPIIAEFKGIGQVTVYHIKSIKNPCTPSETSARLAL